MDKLGDIEIFVNIVNQQGLAAAARKLGLSPASVTARLNRLESSYGVRLLTRTTRQVSLTEEGAGYYQHCLNILQQVTRADESLTNRGGELQGTLRITAPVDIGKQMIAPALADFIADKPKVSAHLNLSDRVVELIKGKYDLAIRYGGLSDNRMIARKLSSNHRVIFASPDYLQEHGLPSHPLDLENHRCICLAREDQSLTTWFFEDGEHNLAIDINPALSSNDGSQVRDWALGGKGIALKSYQDVKADLASGALVSILDEFQANYVANKDGNEPHLYAIYPSKSYLPKRVSLFIEFLRDRFGQ